MVDSRDTDTSISVLDLNNTLRPTITRKEKILRAISGALFTFWNSGYSYVQSIATAYSHN